MIRGRVWKTEDGRIFMTRCPSCGTENWAMAVSSGTCYACGYKATEKDILQDSPKDSPKDSEEDSEEDS